MSDITQALQALDRGDARAAEQLLPLVYEELRRLAAHKMAGERPGQTLQPTALVHEAWLKIAGEGNEQFANRRHFFKAAGFGWRLSVLAKPAIQCFPRAGNALTARLLSA